MSIIAKNEPATRRLRATWVLRSGVLVAVAIALGGCDYFRRPAQSNAPKGQIIAKVGNENVTISELQNEFRLAGISAEKIPDEVSRAVLTELIKRKYFVQRALAANLDREPTVLLDLLRSREQILATALVQRDIRAKTAAIGKADIDRYMINNPLKFAKRTKLTVNQITIGVDAASQALVEDTKQATSLAEIEKKILEKGLPFSKGIGAIFSGDIPEQLLTAVRAKKDTDVFFVRLAQNGIYFQLKSEDADPLAGDDAITRARQLLNSEAAQAELSKKVGSGDAEITYMGDYVKIMAAPGAPGAPAAPPGGAATPPK